MTFEIIPGFTPKVRTATERNTKILESLIPAEIRAEYERISALTDLKSRDGNKIEMTAAKRRNQAIENLRRNRPQEYAAYQICRFVAALDDNGQITPEVFKNLPYLWALCEVCGLRMRDYLTDTPVIDSETGEQKWSQGRRNNPSHPLFEYDWDSLVEDVAGEMSKHIKRIRDHAAGETKPARTRGKGKARQTESGSVPKDDDEASKGVGLSL